VKNYYDQGATAAMETFKVAGILDSLRTFGAGQLGAAKNLVGNLRGGLGGQMHPGTIVGDVPPHMMDMARASQRQEALGNVRQLLPSMAIGGGAYMLHRRNQDQRAQQQQQQAMMAQQPYPPMM
jgi:hypothetical protein